MSEARSALHIAKTKAAMAKNHENGYTAVKRTLIADAKFDRILGEEEFHKIAQEHREQLKQATRRRVLDLLDDEEVELIWESKNEKMQFIAIMECKGELGFISDIVNVIQSSGVCLKHLESRVPTDCGEAQVQTFSLLLHCVGTKDEFLSAADQLAEKKELEKIKICRDDPDPMTDVPWFPTAVWDLDSCAHIMTKYEPELDERHPGFTDLDYRQRRKDIADVAFSYRQGDAIPYVEYSEQEQQTWTSVYKMLKSLQNNCASERYIRNFKKLEEAGIFKENKIPQLQDVSNYMKKQTGFQLRPAAGLLSARDFLSSLAFRTFQCTQYVRHHKCPHHTVEPDVVHELLGHVPMFVDPALAQFSQEIGLASLGASDEDIEHLATLYWFTVEFGLCKENGQLRAYGAGLLSAYGELKHALSGAPEYREFNPSQTAVQTYTDDNYQPLYYVTDSIENAMEKLRNFVAHDIKKPFTVIHNPMLNKVEVIKSTDDVTPVIDDLQKRMDTLCKAINAIRKPEVPVQAPAPPAEVLVNGVA